MREKVGGCCGLLGGKNVFRGKGLCSHVSFNGCLEFPGMGYISLLILFVANCMCVFQNSELQKITNEQFVKAVQEVEQKFL